MSVGGPKIESWLASIGSSNAPTKAWLNDQRGYWGKFRSFRQSCGSAQMRT